MADRTTVQLASGALFLLYPVAVFIGLHYLDPRWVALVLVAIAGFRLLGGRRAGFAPLALAAAVLGATAVTFVSGSAYGLLLYPVMVNALLLVIFAASLVRPPSVIETLARLTEPDLPQEAIRYTRRVTLVWVAFFAVNGSIALATVYLDRHWWVLYNGLIAYVLMGLLFAAEWLVRKRLIDTLPLHREPESSHD